MLCMRKLSENYKIPGRSLPEITARFEASLSRQKNVVKRFLFKNKKVSGEVLTNAIVLHFLSLDDREQDEILNRHVAELGMLLGVDDSPHSEGRSPEIVEWSGENLPPGRKGGRTGQAG